MEVSRPVEPIDAFFNASELPAGSEIVIFTRTPRLPLTEI
jgi:hypothetical protein